MLFKRDVVHALLLSPCRWLRYNWSDSKSFKVYLFLQREIWQDNLSNSVPSNCKFPSSFHCVNNDLFLAYKHQVWSVPYTCINIDIPQAIIPHTKWYYGSGRLLRCLTMSRDSAYSSLSQEHPVSLLRGSRHREAVMDPNYDVNAFSRLELYKYWNPSAGLTCFNCVDLPPYPSLEVLCK